MALGGGTFTVQNKKLAGAYINFVSAAKASVTLGDRGVAALPLVLDWGAEGQVIDITADDFQRNSRKLLGYDYTAEELKGLRDTFINAQRVYIYKLNRGTKAANEFCTAKYPGERGNALKTIITANVDDPEKFDVKTYLDFLEVDAQTKVTKASDLVNNDYVDFKADATLSITANTPLTGGANGAAFAASCKYGTAKNTGAAGNKLSVVITQNADASTFDVKVMNDASSVYTKEKATTTADLETNNYITWADSVALAVGTVKLTGGADADTVSVEDWQSALTALEGKSFNTLGIVSTADEVKSLAISYTKRLRDQVGVKFQTVVFNKAADDKGIINLVTGLKDDPDDPSLVYWVTGAEAGCAVNASLTNRTYSGEFEADTSKTQTQLEECITNGEFVMHDVGGETRVLTDINSKTSVTEEEGEDFKSNQTIRVLDQIGNDIAAIFNDKFLGKIPNDESGRISLWNEIVKHHQQLQTIRAIENFASEDVEVMQGDTKKSVVVNDAVTPTNAMEILYMTCVIA